MGLFGSQFANVVEWQETDGDTIFWKWHQDEIKKDSRLIIRAGQDAIFLYNGRIEGIFKEEGNYEIASQIIPFLSSLKGFKFGFNSGLRAEVLFVNTKEFLIKWGTRNAIMLQAPGLPGGLPIRCYGTLTLKVSDYIALMDQIAGVRDTFTTEDVKERVLHVLDGYLMKWIAAEGKDLFNLQASASSIADGIREDLDMEMQKSGLSISHFYISSFSYPAEVQEKINQAASVQMVGNLDQYQKVKMVDALENNGSTQDMAGSMMGMAMGMSIAQSMAQSYAQSMAQGMTQHMSQNTTQNTTGAAEPPAENTAVKRFCSQCGAKLEAGAKFCSQCGAKI